MVPRMLATKLGELFATISQPLSGTGGALAAPVQALSMALQAAERVKKEEAKAEGAQEKKLDSVSS